MTPHIQTEGRHPLPDTLYAPSSQTSVQFSRSVVSDSLRPHGLQHARPPCPSPTPGACSNSCPRSVIPSNHLILCRPLLLPLSIFLSTGVFSELGTKAPLHLRHILHRVTAEKTLGVWVHGAYKQANVETREQWAGEAGSATPEPMRAPAGSSGPPTKGVTAVRMSPSRPGGKYASLRLTYAARTSLRGKWPHTTRSSTLMEAGLSSVNKRR